MPKCELCIEEVDETYECEICGTEMCDDCREISDYTCKTLCNDCLENNKEEE